jgi:hypothetical protein
LRQYEPELNSGSDSDESDEGEDEDEGEDYEDGTGSPTAKRRPLDDTSVRKRRKLGGEVTRPLPPHTPTHPNIVLSPAHKECPATNAKSTAHA